MEDFIIKMLQIIAVSIGLGVGAYYAKYLTPLLIWIKGGIEDGDGKLENKELQIAFFSILCLFMILSVTIWGTIYPELAWYGAFGGAGVLYSINSIVEGYKSTHNNKKEESPPKEESPTKDEK